MPSDCSAPQFDFGVVEGRPVVAAFDGGAVTSDAGGLLLGHGQRGSGSSNASPAASAMGARRVIEHDIAAMGGQRVFGIALGGALREGLLRPWPGREPVYGRLPPRKCSLRRSSTIWSAAAM